MIFWSGCALQYSITWCSTFAALLEVGVVLVGKAVVPATVPGRKGVGVFLICVFELTQVSACTSIKPLASAYDERALGRRSPRRLSIAPPKTEEHCFSHFIVLSNPSRAPDPPSRSGILSQSPFGLAAFVIPLCAGSLATRASAGSPESGGAPRRSRAGCPHSRR